jgi:CubicO group peptidase (beta-lactamase class C family)
MLTQHARSLSIDPQTVDKRQKEKQRSWAKRGLRIAGGLLGLAVLLVISYFAAAAIAIGPVTEYRMASDGDSNIYSYKIFPQRLIATGTSVSTLKQASLVNFPTTITFDYNGTQYTTGLDDLFAHTDTQAFIVVRDNSVVYERYLNGTSRDTLHMAFSMSKSFTSALIGIAVDEGKIKSIHDPVIEYVPELKGRGFDNLTIQDMLLMSSGVAFQKDVSLGPLTDLVNPFVSDDAQQYYSDNLRHLLLNVHRSDESVGTVFHYNDFYPLLEGLILQRVTGETVSQYTQEKLWQPMGAEYPASWSLDSAADGFEKMNSGFNARAIDYARIGLLFLNQGRWNGQQIISQQWIADSTTPDPSDTRPWQDSIAFQQAGGYYKYHWWGLNNPDGTYDYLAWGKWGQFLYVSPSTKTVVVRLGADPQPQKWPFAIRALIGSLK